MKSFIEDQFLNLYLFDISNFKKVNNGTLTNIDNKYIVMVIVINT